MASPLRADGLGGGDENAVEVAITIIDEEGL
jgi:hypothetical protein